MQSQTALNAEVREDMFRIWCIASDTLELPGRRRNAFLQFCEKPRWQQREMLMLKGIDEKEYDDLGLALDMSSSATAFESMFGGYAVIGGAFLLGAAFWGIVRR